MDAHRRSAIYSTCNTLSNQGASIGGSVEAYFERIEYDIQFDGILPANGMVYLACICERCQYYDRDNDQKRAEDIGLLRGWQGRSGVPEAECVDEQAIQGEGEADGEDRERVKEGVKAHYESKEEYLQQTVSNMGGLARGSEMPRKATGFCQ